MVCVIDAEMLIWYSGSKCAESTQQEQLTNAMEQSVPRKADSRLSSQSILAVHEFAEPACGLCPDPDESCPHLHIIIIISKHNHEKWPRPRIS
jgi:hypothetical protein